MPTFVFMLSFLHKSILAAAVWMLCLLNTASAQDDLFQTQKPKPKQGFVIGVNGNFDLPAADMAKRYGLGYRIGPSVHFKTSSNWLIGVKYDFLLGNSIKEDSLLANVTNKDGLAYNTKGELIGVLIRRSGYAAGFYVGTVFDVSTKSSDNGIVVQMGIGFLQHKLHFKAQDDEVPQILKPYSTGYDRLTNGLYLEPFLGYQYMDINGLLSFYVGANATLGFTKGRRAYLYDVQRPGTDGRFDVLWGLRGGLYVPVIKKKSEEIFF